MTDNYTFKDFEASLHSVYEYYKGLYLAVKPDVPDDNLIDNSRDLNGLHANLLSTLYCFVHLYGTQFTDRAHKAKTERIIQQLGQSFYELQYQ